MTVEHIGRSTPTAQHFDGVTQRFRFRTAAKSSSSSSFVGLLPPFVSGFDSDGDGRDRGRSYGWLRSGICISGGRPSSLAVLRRVDVGFGSDDQNGQRAIQTFRSVGQTDRRTSGPRQCLSYKVYVTSYMNTWTDLRLEWMILIIG